jgi:hypothetical protein
MDNFIIDDPPGRFIDNQYLVDQSYSRHLLQTGASDKLLGDLIARMKREGMWDRAALVVSADHGVSFHARGFRREVKPDNLADIAFVPLFVKRPGQAQGSVVERHTCTTQIPRLVSSALHLDLPWPEDACKRDEIAVLNSFGSTQRGSVREYQARREATIRRKFELFGQGWNPVYGFGPDPQLIGRPVESLHPDPAQRNRINFDPATDLENVDTYGSRVPGMLEGVVGGAPQAPTSGEDLAVAVNGKIAAVTRAYPLQGKTRFIAMVRPHFLRAARNAVEVFTISGFARRPILHSLGGVNLDE